MLNAGKMVVGKKSKMTRFLALFFGLITVFIATGVEWFENERAFLINGISRLPIIGIPGPLALYRTNAFPVITGKFSDRIYAPVVAGAIVGHGRVIAFGHDGYFSKEILNKADGERFFINALQWTGKKDKPFAGLLRVSNDLEDFIRGKGFRVKRLTGQLTREDLKEVDLVVATVNGLSSAETRKMLIEYIENGGGAIVASLGWGWLQLNPSKTLIEDHPGNLLLQVCGIAWADGYLDTSSGYFDTSILPPALNLVDAIKFIRDADKIGANVSESILSQAAATLINVVNVLPKHEKDLYSVIERFAEDGMSIVPTDKKPLRLPQNALERIKFSQAVRMLMSAPAEQVRAHPAGLDFPGKVRADAKRIFRTLRITPRGERWHSTGLYAAAGELVTVYISENLAKRGLKLRIGCHTDKLWDKPVWQRAPELSRVFELNRIENKVSSPFGGLVYVEIPHSFFGDSIELTISNVVQAPYFKYGETSVELWKKEIRNYPAPWAEIESKYIVITLPSENIRNLDDVEEVCIFWDKVQEANARLAALKTPRHDRIVLDRQISAGYMHSGYPIMALLDQQKKIADPKELKKGNWGFFHELGHNH